ncbi:MAG TPA: VOC family protein [Gemmatimonadales bacterium]|nr:VOC family protein [Gemmatimonadales bacterium]
MPKMIFVNLPVTDLAATTRFYEAIGCVKNEQFSNDKAVSMMWSDAIAFMLLRKEFYSTFTSKEIVDARQSSETLIALSFESREEVDAFAAAAGRAGGKVDVRPPQELGFMYSRAVEDPDGHVFEPVWMDPSAIEGAADNATAHA